MNVVMKRRAKDYLSFLWLSFISAFPLAVGIYYYQEDISSNNALIILVLIFSLPVGISYFSLLMDIVNSYRYKLLPIALLLFWPKLFILVLVFGPFAYLIYLTWIVQGRIKAS